MLTHCLCFVTNPLLRHFVVGLPPDVQFTNFFFIYACKKQPLQLPQHQGQKGQLPNGWVNGSKELFQK